MRRISVIRDGKIVPLLPGRPVSGSLSDSSGLIVETHSIDAIEVPDHQHSTFCLHMQISRPSAMEWWSEGRYGRETFGPGSLILLAPGTRDRLRWSGASQRVIASIDEPFLIRAAQDLGKNTFPGFRNRWNFEDVQVRHLLSEMRREMESDWATGSLYADHLAMLLSITLVQKYAGLPAAAPAKGGISKVRLNRVLEFIAANTHRNLKLSDLADIADISRFHFARLFHQEMGVPPYRYLLDQRMRQAESLLRLTSRTIAEVAAETGFANPGQFARAFKRHAGVSPSEWKRSSESRSAR